MATKQKGGRSNRAAGRAHEQRPAAAGRSGDAIDPRPPAEVEGIMVRISRAVSSEVDEMIDDLHRRLGVTVTKRSIIEDAVREHLARMRKEIHGKNVSLHK